MVFTGFTGPVNGLGYLEVFKDVLAVDSTVVKVHAWVRALTGELVKYRVTREAFGDSRAFGIDSSLQDALRGIKPASAGR